MSRKKCYWAFRSLNGNCFYNFSYRFEILTGSITKSGCMIDGKTIKSYVMVYCIAFRGLLRWLLPYALLYTHFLLHWRQTISKN